MGKIKLNVVLLDKVKKHILAEPKRIHMKEWKKTDKNLYKHACHTVGCIAGWAVMLGGTREDKKKDIFWTDVEDVARRLLGIDSNAAFHLFFDDIWPKKFSLSKATPGTKKYAKIVASYIDYFKEEFKED